MGVDSMLSDGSDGTPTASLSSMKLIRNWELR